MGYDGYGNYLVKNSVDFENGKEKLQSRGSGLLAEEFINFKMELAVMIAKTKTQIKTYPVVQTIQKNHICHTVIVPAKIEKNIVKKIKEIAAASVKAVNGFGIFGIEMFLTKNNDILIN